MADKGSGSSASPAERTGPGIPAVFPLTRNLLLFLGLVIALTLWFLSSAFLIHERGFDGFHNEAGRIHRVESRLSWAPGRTQIQATTPFPLAEVLTGTTGVESVVRLRRPYTRTLLVPQDGEPLSEPGGIWADGSFFRVFDFSFLEGDPGTALSPPRSIVLTESLAERCFPDGDGLGRTIRINDRMDVTVTGIIRDIPLRSHLSFTFVLSTDLSETPRAGWESSTIYTYVRLEKEARAHDLEAEIRDLPAFRGGIDAKTLSLRPLTRIHFARDLYFRLSSGGDRSASILAVALALLILLLAWLNLPLSSARAASSEPGPAAHRLRFKDVFFLAGAALIPAAVAAILLTGTFGRLIGRRLAPLTFASGLLLAAVTLLLIGLGAFKSSVFSGPFLRRPARFIQIIVTVILVLAAIGAVRKSRRLSGEQGGINPDGVLVLDLSHLDRDRLGRAAALRQELLRHPHILSGAFSLRLPFEMHGTTPVTLDGDSGTPVMVSVNLVNPDFDDAFGLEFTPSSRIVARSVGLPDGIWACLINESAAAAFGAEDADRGGASLIGRQVVFGPDNRPVVAGVIRDFPCTDRGRGDEPLVLIYRNGGVFTYPRLSLKLYQGDLHNTLDFIRQKYRIVYPGDVFDGRFFDREYLTCLRKDRDRGALLALFAGAAVLLMLLGSAGNAPGRRVSDPDPGRLGWGARLAALPGIEWVLAFLYALLAIRPSLLYQGFGKMSELPMFGPERALLETPVFRPGGIVEAAAGWLSQFFPKDLPGALIILALAWCLGRLTVRLIPNLKPAEKRILAFIPALLLLMMGSRFDNPLPLGLALTASVGGYAIYAGFRPKGFFSRTAVFAVLFAAVYLISGGASAVFVLMAVLHEILKRKSFPAGIAFPAIAGAITWLGGLVLFDLFPRDLYLKFLPLHPMQAVKASAPLLWMFCLFFPLLLTAAFLLEKRTRKPAAGRAPDVIGKGWPRTVPALFLIILSILALGFSRATDQRVLHELIARSHHRDWQGVVDQVRRLPPGSYNLYGNYQVNRSLYHMGRLLDEMFAYPQRMEAFALIPFETERFVMRDEAVIDVALDLGGLNIAEHLSLELLEVVGAAPLIMQDLALVHFAKRQGETARVFLEAHTRDPVFGGRAREILSRLADDPDFSRSERVKALRAMMLEADVANISVEGLLKALLERNPYNRMAFEYLIATYLMERRLGDIIETLDRIDTLGYDRLPRHLEEAVLLHMLDTGAGVDLRGRRLSPESIERYREFTRLMSDGESAGSPEMRRKFGRSYFYYYSFNRSGVNE